MKKNICFVTSHYGVTKNGPGTFADNFVKMCIKDERFNLTLISSDSDRAKYGENLYHIKANSLFGSTFSTAFKIKKLLKRLDREYNFDAVYFNTFRLGLFSTNFNKPLYNNLNDYYFAVKHKNQSIQRVIYNKFWTHFYEKILKSAKTNFVNSNYTLEKILSAFNFNRERFKITFKGIDTNKFSYKYCEIDKKLNLLFVGSDYNRKGLDIIIEALATLKDQINFNLKIVGYDKNQHENYKKKIEDLGLKESIELLGKRTRDEIVEYHKDAHIYLLPSRREALGVSVIEAAASGTTVIAANCGGIPEIIEGDREGIILKNPTPEDLAKGIIKLYDDPALRKNLTEAAREKVTLFSFENVYKKISEELYE